MKKSDYQVKRQNVKIDFVRSAKINNKDQNITIRITLNENKGLYSIQPKITTNMIETSTTNNKALLKVVQDLTYEAVLYCQNWKKEWSEANPKEADPSNPQIPGLDD